LVESRRDGTSVYYRVKDPRTLELLELVKGIILATLEGNRVLLDDLAVEDFGTSPGTG
jgi:DNA-binding transcriptional ArsR family regulator